MEDRYGPARTFALSALLLTLGLVGSGCPRSDEPGAPTPEPECGNGACDSGETLASCPTDCKACSEGCDGATLHLCGAGGADESFTCPATLGSSCGSVAGGFGCLCGSVTAEGICFEDPAHSTDVAVCESNALTFYACPKGKNCDDSTGHAQCACDNRSDGTCPGSECLQDPDCQTCTPDCTGKVCGSNGCTGTCSPGCAQGQECAGGQCVSPGWTSVASSTTDDLRRITGGGTNKRWIAANPGILEWNGSAWYAATNTDVSFYTWNSVYYMDGEVWAAGSGIGRRAANGQWSRLPASGRTLNDIHGTSSNLWAVGEGGAILHWTGGASFTEVPSPTTDTLIGVWANSSEAWAVGLNGLLIHFDGSSWSVEPSGVSETLLAIGGSSADDLWIVGKRGTILRRVGGAFQQVSQSLTTANLTGVWTQGSSTWVVGMNGTILKWDGADWSIEPSGATQTLSGIWGDGTNLWVTGYSGTILRR